MPYYVKSLLNYDTTLRLGGQKLTFKAHEIKALDTWNPGSFRGILQLVEEVDFEKVAKEEKERVEQEAEKVITAIAGKDEEFNLKTLSGRKKFKKHLEENKLLYGKYEPIDMLYTFQYDDIHLSSAIKRLLCSLHSIKNQNCNIIVLNGSKRCIKEYLEGFNIQYVHKPIKQRGSKCKLINYGAKKLVKTKYFLLSDIDLVYPSDYVEYMQETYVNKKSKKIFRVVPFNHNLNIFLYEKDLNNVIRKNPSKDNKGGFAHGNGLIHRKSLLSINGYDEDMVGYGPEDDLFNIRLGFINELVYDKYIYTIHLCHKRTNLIQVNKNHAAFAVKRKDLLRGSKKYLIANKGK